MIGFAWYLLKVIICSAVFYGYYFLFLRNKKFHRWNRFYLIMAVVISVTLPVIRINPDQGFRDSVEVSAPFFTMVSNGDAYVEKIKYITAERTERISADSLFKWSYISVCLFFFLAFVLALNRIRSIIRNYDAIKSNGIFFLNTSEKGTPFSFLNYIFWNSNIMLDTVEGKHILLHEIAHVRQHHTLDKLFMQSVLLVFWINPFFWLIRRESGMIHEFLADSEAVKDHNSAALAAMMLQAGFTDHGKGIGNYFFQSQIKRRLKMISQIEKPLPGYINRLLVLPLIAITAFGFTIKYPDKVERVLAKIISGESRDLSLRFPATISGKISQAVFTPASTVKTIAAMLVPATGTQNKEGMRSPSDTITEQISSYELRGGTDEVIVIFRSGRKVVMAEDEAIMKGYIAWEILAKRVNDLEQLWHRDHPGISFNPVFVVDSKSYNDGMAMDDLKIIIEPRVIVSIRIREPEAAKENLTTASEQGVIEVRTASIPVHSPLSSDAENAGMKKTFGNQIQITGQFVENAEQAPSFRGGEIALQKYIAEDLKFNTELKENQFAGECTIRFIVSNYGKIYGFKIISSPEQTNEALANEIIAILNKGPKWQAGITGGEKVTTYFTLHYKYPVRGS